MTELQPADHGAELTKADVTRITNKWPDLLRLPVADQSQADQIRGQVAILSEPVDHVWLMKRIASLLHPYYAGSAPQSTIEMMAGDWAAALGQYPRWAIHAAVRWWKSEHNSDRRHKPLEGDIAARCRTEVGIIFVAERALRKFDEAGAAPQPEPERKEPTPEELERRREFAAKVMAEKFPTQRKD